MKYNSVREYFYKFHNVLYLFILLPLLVFTFLYYAIQSNFIQSPYKDDDFLIRIVVIAALFITSIDWIVTFVLVHVKLKQIRTFPSLGERLDRYYALTTVRFVLITFDSVLLAFAYFMTEAQLLTIASVANLALLVFLWPSTRKVCRDLQLRGDEYTLVYFKKDVL